MPDALTDSAVLRSWEEVPELRSVHAPRGLRIVRLTTGPHAHSHIYPESQVFTPDGRRFIFQRLLGDLGELSMQKRRREYWMCDIDDGFALVRLTDHPEATAPVVSPDGRWMYYFLNNQTPASRRGIELRRVDLETLEHETLMRLDRPVEGSPLDAPPSRLYSLATVRADGRAVCTGVFLGDGRHEPAPWGVLVCDLQQHEARIVLHSPDLINPHPQYARTTDPRRMHDLLIQENLGVWTDADGHQQDIGSGCLLRVIRDDGSGYRVVPCGGDAQERCHGHQEWRGGMASVIVGVDRRLRDGRYDRPLIEAAPIPADRDDLTPPRLLPAAEAARHDITAALHEPAFAHTAFDPTGTRMVGDCYPPSGKVEETVVYLARLDAEPGSHLRLRYLMHPMTSYTRDQITHPHAAFSPDGRRVIFNSDFGGLPQVWLADGYEPD